MKRTSTNKTGIVHTHALKFSKVADGRKQPICGRWIRDDRFCVLVSKKNSVNVVCNVGHFARIVLNHPDLRIGGRTYGI